MKRLMLILVLCVCMMLSPTVALADEIGPMDGFVNGIGDFFSPDETVMVESRPRVREVVGEDDESSTDMNSISDVVDAWSTIPVGNGSFGLLSFLQLMLGQQHFANYAGIYILPAIGIVFILWGVRKSIGMIMTALRRGHMNA